MAGFLVSFGVAFVLCAGAFFISYAADQGYTLDLPSVDFAAILGLLPALPRKRRPVYCAATKRWRDPATNRFVKSPTRA